jgi:hypothetical protein
MGNATSVPLDDQCEAYNVTVAAAQLNPTPLFFNITEAPQRDTPLYPVNTFSFVNAFILFCIQGLIFKPISSLLKRHSPLYVMCRSRVVKM